jgi:hypothetical protein
MAGFDPCRLDRLGPGLTIQDAVYDQLRVFARYTCAKQ